MGKKSGGVRIKQLGGSHAGKPPMHFSPMEEWMQEQQNMSPEEMIPLPPVVNRQYQVFWPIHESFTMKIDSFQVVYPNYIDSTKSIAQGRRIGVASAVAVPSVTDLSQALQQLGIRHVIQPYKGYSPDPTCLWDNPGRCLVDVKSSSNKTAVGETTKRELLLVLANRIKSGNFPDRILRLQREEDQRNKENAERLALITAAAAEQVAANNASSAAAKAVAVSGNRKKAKGKRK